MSGRFPFLLTHRQVIAQMRCGGELCSNFTAPEKPFHDGDIVPAYLMHFNGSCCYFVNEPVIMGLLHERLIYLKSTMPTHRNYELTIKGAVMKLSDLPKLNIRSVSILPDGEMGVEYIVRPPPKPLQDFGGIPISIRWFANWQRAATFTLDIELDWGHDPVFMIEFVFGIGFQVGFAMVVSR